MNIVKKSGWLLFMLLIIFAIAIACSNEPKESQPDQSDPNGSGTNPAVDSQTTPSQSQEPVTLTIFTPAMLDEFMDVMGGNEINKKFPHITLNHVGGVSWGEEIPALLGTNVPIDLVVVQAVSFNHVVKIFDLQYDIDELIKKHNYDLSPIQPNILQGMRELTPEGKLYGLPVSTGAIPLMYNIDIFDRFGEDFPKDNMVWDEVYEISRKMTRVEDDVQYHGLVTDFVAFAIFNSLSASYIDPDTNKAMFSTDPRWTRLTNNITRFFQVSGMDLSAGWNWDSTNKLFHEEQRAAMAWYAVNLASPANWDMVTGPEFPEARGIGGQANPVAYFPAVTSKHKDTVFEMMAWLTSEEYQLQQSKKGILPIIDNEKVREAFATEVPELQGKNVQALVSQASAVPSIKTDQYADGHGAIFAAMIQVATGEKDINTALRDADELLNQKIKEALDQK